MAGQCFSLVRGRAMRVTRLDGCGRRVAHQCSAIVSEGFVSVAFTANVTEGTPIQQTNAAGKQCINVPGTPQFNNYGLVFTFCEVDPELYGMLTGQAVVYNTEGDAVGFRVSSGVDLTKTGFALEVWSDVPGVACEEGAEGSYGYLLLPFVQGGVIGDFTIENGAVTFTISNATTTTGSSWGNGPYDVVPQDNTGVAGPLLEPIGPEDHLHAQWTSVAPPEPGCTCMASGPAATTANAGTPGTWDPVDSYPPANFAALEASTVVADPTTAWGSGEYVVLGDNSHAYWDGTAWAVGEAP